MPRASNCGAITRSPASPPPKWRGPASNSKAWVAVSTRIALPCPISIALMRQSPGSGRSGRQHKSGNMHSQPRRRAGQPGACKAHTMPATAHSNHGHGAAATLKLAQSALPTHATTAIARSNTHAPACPATAATPAMAGATENMAHSNANGVTRKVTAGIATALARGDPSDTWCTRNASNGVKPSVTVSCKRAACDSAAPQRCRHPASASRGACTTRSRIATAPNDSQKPAAIGAHGSSITTAAAANASTRPADIRKRDHPAASTTSNMKNVRRDGTPQPANRQYASPTPIAAAPPAMRAGTHSASPPPRQRARRHTAASNQAARPAIDVTCMPLMDTRWVMPLRLKRRQSSRATPAWSPIASAINTGA